MKDLIVQKVTPNVFLLRAGYQRHFIFADEGCDIPSTVMLFIILAYNNIVTDFDCNIAFFKDLLIFLKEELGVERNIKFTGRHIPFRDDFYTGLRRQKALFYSGGKDSTLAKALLEKTENFYLTQFISPAFDVVRAEQDYADTFTTNINNELFYLNKELTLKIGLEIMLPIIYKNKHVFMGIEKEGWEFSKYVYGYNIDRLQSMYENHGIYLDSPIKHLTSIEIYRELKKLQLSYVKCNFGTIVGKGEILSDGSDFCYRCSRCDVAYVMGADLDVGFDRKKYEATKLNGEKFVTWLMKNLKEKENKDSYLFLQQVGVHYGRI